MATHEPPPSPPPRPEPVLDPDLEPSTRALLLSAPQALIPATAPAPPAPGASWRFPLARWVLDHPIATILITATTLLVSLRLLARLLVFVLPLLVAVALVALVVTARRDTEPAAHAAARRHHGRYILAADLDAQARALMVRAQRAADSVTAATVVRSGHIDAVDNAVVLPHQLWESAQTLRRISELRARDHGRGPAPHGAQLADLLAERHHVLAQASASVAARVEALEAYAQRVAAAQRTLEHLEELGRLVAEQEEFHDLLAATAADEHAIAHLDHLTQRAAAAQESLRRAAREAGQAALRLPRTQ